MAKLKIALCITDLDVGGAERAMVALATRMDRSRFAPTVFCLGPRPKRAEASCVPPLEETGIAVHCLEARGFRSFPRVVRELTRHFRRDEPDVVQTFLFHANLVGRIAAHRAGVRATVAGIRVAERRARWHLWLDRATSRWVDRFVCVSEAVARFSISEGRLHADRVLVIPNGIDLSRYPAPKPIDPSCLGIPAGRRMVVFVGRLEPQKGGRWLLESASRWLTQLSDCDLVMIGQGSEEAMLRQLSGELGIADRVHWVGWRPDVPQIMAASSLLVLPSKWEGMPNVVLEAMASGLPVVASDVEGVRELLGENSAPQVVSFGDAAALADQVVRLFGDAPLAAQCGNANRLRAGQYFGIERTVAAYEELWSSLAER